MLTVIFLGICLTSSLIINFLLYKALKNQLNRVQLYESWIVEYEQWVKNVRDSISFTYIKMRNIDEKQIFFKDDDVGFVFTELLNLIKQLNDRIQK